MIGNRTVRITAGDPALDNVGERLAAVAPRGMHLQIAAVGVQAGPAQAPGSTRRVLGWGSVPARNPGFTGRAKLLEKVRTQLLELARPMLESLVHEVAGVKVLSMHHDISTVTGEEVVIFSLVGTPRFG